MRRRDLDSNIIRLRAGAGIDPHVGPDLDVLILGLARRSLTRFVVELLVMTGIGLLLAFYARA